MSECPTPIRLFYVNHSPPASRTLSGARSAAHSGTGQRGVHVARQSRRVVALASRVHVLTADCATPRAGPFHARQAHARETHEELGGVLHRLLNPSSGEAQSARKSISSRMWRRGSRCEEDILRLSKDVRPDVRAQVLRRDQLHSAAQHLFQKECQPHEVFKRLLIRRELDQQVHVAVQPGLASEDGAEQRRTPKRRISASTDLSRLMAWLRVRGLAFMQRMYAGLSAAPAQARALTRIESSACARSPKGQPDSIAAAAHCHPFERHIAVAARLRTATASPPSPTRFRPAPLLGGLRTLVREGPRCAAPGALPFLAHERHQLATAKAAANSRHVQRRPIRYDRLHDEGGTVLAANLHPSLAPGLVEQSGQALPSLRIRVGSHDTFSTSPTGRLRAAAETPRR